MFGSVPRPRDRRRFFFFFFVNFCFFFVLLLLLLSLSFLRPVPLLDDALPPAAFLFCLPPPPLSSYDDAIDSVYADGRAEPKLGPPDPSVCAVMTDAVSNAAVVSSSSHCLRRRFSRSMATMSRLRDLYSSNVIMPSASNRLLSRTWSLIFARNGEVTVECTVRLTRA